MAVNVKLWDHKIGDYVMVKNDNPIYDGAKVMLEFMAKGGESVRWFKNGSPLAIGDNSYRVIFESALFSDSGEYMATVSNAAGSVSTAPYNLVISSYPPVLELNPVDWVGGAGTDAIFTARAKAGTWQTVTWYYSEDDGTTWQQAKTEWGGATETLTIPAVLAMNGWIVKAEYTNGGTSIETGTAKMEVLDMKTYTPQFNKKMHGLIKPVTIPKGGTVEFTFISDKMPSKSQVLFNRELGSGTSECHVSISGSSKALSWSNKGYDIKAGVINGTTIGGTLAVPQAGRSYTVVLTAADEIVLQRISSTSSSGDAFEGQLMDITFKDDLGNALASWDMKVSSAGLPATNVLPDSIGGNDCIICDWADQPIPEGGFDWAEVDLTVAAGVSVTGTVDPEVSVAGDELTVETVTIPAGAAVTWLLDGVALEPQPAAGKLTSKIEWNGQMLQLQIPDPDADPATWTWYTKALTVTAPPLPHDEYTDEYMAEYSGGGAANNELPPKTKAKTKPRAKK